MDVEFNINNITLIKGGRNTITTLEKQGEMDILTEYWLDYKNGEYISNRVE